MVLTKQQAYRVRIALVALGQCGADLAQSFEVSPSTVSHWLTGRQPAPDDFLSRTERILNLKPGVLDSTLLDLADRLRA